MADSWLLVSVNPANVGVHQQQNGYKGKSVGRKQSHYPACTWQRTTSKDRIWDRTFQPSNTKRKPQSTRQFAALLHLAEEHSQYYWPLNRVSVETRNMLAITVQLDNGRCHLSVIQRGLTPLCATADGERGGKKMGEIRGKLEQKIEAEMEAAWKRASGGRAPRCSTAPVISDIHKMILILVCVSGQRPRFIPVNPLSHIELLKGWKNNRILQLFGLETLFTYCLHLTEQKRLYNKQC